MKTEPTGEHEGIEERICSVCQFAESNVIPKLVHNLVSGSFGAALGGGAYFPYYSNFYGERVTESLSTEQRLALTLSGENGKIYELIDVFDLAVVTVKGEDLVPADGITFTIAYELPRGEYESFIIYDENFAEVTYFAEGDSISIVSEGNGRFILAGEVIPEKTTGDATSEVTGPSDTENLPVSGTATESGNRAMTVLIVIAIILIVLIAVIVYVYVFKQYY